LVENTVEIEDKSHEDNDESEELVEDLDKALDLEFENDEPLSSAGLLKNATIVSLLVSSRQKGTISIQKLILYLPIQMVPMRHSGMEVRRASTSNTLGRSVSAETVRRVIRKAGYNGGVARKSP
ncbi:hypothetical protein TNCV_1427811, partial [Trichonephila clavipes]